MGVQYVVMLMVLVSSMVLQGVLSEKLVCYENQIKNSLWKKKPGFQRIMHSEKWTPRSLLESLKNCTVYHGNIMIEAKCAEKNRFNEHVRIEDLWNLRNLQTINGRVILNFGEYPEITNLSFFSNLREIRNTGKLGFVLTESKVEMIGFSNVRLNVHEIRIGINPDLCYLNNFETLNSSIDFTLIQNKDKVMCEIEGKICAKACDPNKGCWGPGDSDCFACRWRIGEDCVDSCTSRRGYFTPTEGNRCRKCHADCKFGCFGPGKTKCQLPPELNDFCRKYEFYSNITRQCEDCFRGCFGAGYINRTQLVVRACSGPGNGAGPGGCSLRCPDMTFLTVSDGLLECFPYRKGYLEGQNATWSDCLQQSEDNILHKIYWYLDFISSILIIIMFFVGVFILVLYMRSLRKEGQKDRSRKSLSEERVSTITYASTLNTSDVSTHGEKMLVEFDQTFFTPIKNSDLIQEHGKVGHSSYIKCYFPNISPGEISFSKLLIVLEPLFIGKEIVEIEQRRSRVAEANVANVTSRTDNVEERSYCDVDGNEHQEENMDQWLHKINKNDDGHIMIVKGRRTVIWISPPSENDTTRRRQQQGEVQYEEA